jgi:PAS domain S-box-containing protein
LVAYTLGQVLYGGGYIGELTATTLQGKLAWDSFEYAGAFCTVVSIVGVARRFAGKATWHGPLKWSLMVIPLFVLIGTLLEPWHGAFRGSAHIVPAPPFGALWYDFVWIDLVANLFIYGCLFYTLAVLLRSWRRGDRLVRQQSSALILGVAVPTLLTVPLVFIATPFEQRDPTPFTFMVGSAFIAWGLFRARLFQLLPVARERVVENMADGVLVADTQGRVVDANPAAAHILDVKVGELLGQRVEGVLSRAGLRLPAQPDRESRPQSRQRDGEARWFELSLRAICDPNGQRQGDILLLRDVTAAELRQHDLESSNELLETRVAERTAALSREIEQRRQAQRELADSERRFRGIFNQAFQMVGLLDLEGTLLDVNQAALDLAGLEAADVVGKPFWDTPWWKDAEGGPARLQQSIRSAAAGALVRYEVEHVDRHGDRHTIDFSLKAIRDEQGHPTLLIPEGRDITALKRLEQERLSLAEQLSQSQRLEAIGRLAGGVAHDFNNLLTVITGSTSLLLSMTETNAEQAARAQETLEAAKRAADLTRQLLTFSRRQVVEPGVMDPAARLQTLLKLLPRVLGEDVVLDAKVVGTPGNIRMDRTQFEQIVMNLAVNARDAMPHGGRLEIALAHVAVDAAAVRVTVGPLPAGYVVLSVTDTGTGIPAEAIPHIFEPFFTTKKLGMGTGLGLATVHGIVTQLGGAVTVDSRMGHGTTFRVYLPSSAEEAAATAAAPVPHIRQRGARVLVVEDQASVRDLVVRVLGRRGFEVIAFPDGAPALEWARGQAAPCDVVLTDVVMPEVGGRALADTLRARWADVPVVFMSGHTDDIVLRHGIEEAREHFIAKPFTPDELVQKLALALEAGKGAR